MAFGDFARLDDYNPNARWDDFDDPNAVAAARMRRSVTERPSQAEGGPRAERIMGGLGDITRAIGDATVTGLTDYANARVTPAGPITEEQAFRANQTADNPGKALKDMVMMSLPMRNPLGAVSQAEIRGGTLYAGGGRGAKPLTGFDPADFGNVLKPGYLSPGDQLLFAQRYPEAGAFQLKIDKNKTPPKQFESKTWTPEEARLAAAREQVVADMKAEPWTPYFDPAKRHDVNLAEYERLFGKPEDTRALVMSGPATGPKGPNAAQKHLDISTGEQSQAALGAAYDTGKALPGAEGFYKMGQLEKEFVDTLGPDEGRRQFVRMFTQPMAATTGGSTPTSNLIQSGFANYMREKGLPLPLEKAADIPYPVGGSKYGARQNLQQYNDMLYRSTADIAHTEHPKRYDFDWSFRGRRDAPVIDEQMMGLMTAGDKAAPPSGGYGLYAEGVHKAAAGSKVDPIQYQEVGWAGHKRGKEIAEALKKKRTQAEAEAGAFSGQPMITDVNEAIERTSRLLQIPPKEVVQRGLVRGQLPIYGLAGATALGALADQSNYDPLRITVRPREGL